MELVLEHVTKNFGGLRAASDVSFTVRDKVIFGLIGPNGAGKTTVFNLVTGIYKPDSGTIRFGKTDLGPLKPAQIAGAGVGRTFQNIRLFGQLTVIENLLVACELQKKAHLPSAVLRLPIHYEDESTMHARALELLRVFDLHEAADDAPTALSYGNQRRLEIARAMMLKPKVLLLDEPAAGMNYGEAEGLKTQIRWLRDTFDVSVVLVEHNMQVVMGVCEEIHVLDHGETIAHGTPAAIRRDAKVLAAYLGEDDEAPAVRAAVRDASSPPLGELDPAGPAPQRLSAPELADLERGLKQNLERGLSAPDELEASPANVTEVVTEPAPKPAPPAPTSAPDVAKLDREWGSDPEIEAHKNGTNGVHRKKGDA
jgi:branched-chain amino acid transport system ATP-binding protein